MDRPVSRKVVLFHPAVVIASRCRPKNVIRYAIRRHIPARSASRDDPDSRGNATVPPSEVDGCRRRESMRRSGELRPRPDHHAREAAHILRPRRAFRRHTVDLNTQRLAASLARNTVNVRCWPASRRVALYGGDHPAKH